jgi:hypothetical protein
MSTGPRSPEGKAKSLAAIGRKPKSHTATQQKAMHRFTLNDAPFIAIAGLWR